ncbi:putative fungal specific transcription factor domain-containing [Rosellinia necatrix]|uniref:Putative fungal specific transcription factor domain-containing n=1 Tax=Rosellinia necatrix TaxID=77044 RepID=A0A1W2TQX0_ROSNE|nr:putative fungal specific transcription factor domain-containing [Rosellinia necatrix]
MSATPPATTASPSHSKPTKVLACVHCQYRKIKCDRQQPCSNCIKAKIACKPSIPAPPHKRRRPNQDLLERLARCEKLLKQYADGNVPPRGEPALAPASVPAPVAAEPSSSSSSSLPASLLAKKGDVDAKPAYKPGKVVEEDGNVRFMDNYIRISFHDELAAMRNIIDDDDHDQESESGTVGLSPDNNADLFLGVEDTTIDLQELQPDLVNVFRLWQLFIDRVNPIIKVVHIPSLQSYVLDSANDINKIPLPYQALLFAIYTMTVVSLTNQEAIQLLGTTREDALNRFTRGTKLALTRSNFLKNYNMTILQALALYMLSLNGRTDNHTVWIMGGTVMRIAQKMGYHRDGEQFNLSPFEAEMRRRLWWHVLTQDSRYAMMSGLSHSWVPSNWDTKMPQNLDDTDLSPNSLEPLVPRNGPTEMAFVLLIYNYQRFTNRTHREFEAAFLALRDGGKRDPEQQYSPGPIETYRALVDKIDAELAEFERKYVDPSAGGIQEAASLIRPLFIEKMRTVMIPMREQPEWGTEIFDQIDSLFKSFIDSHSRNRAVYRRLASTGFLWFTRAGFQPDALLLFTAKLYKRPTGTLTERAWAALDSIHELHPDLFDLSQKKFDRQAHFTLKAWAVREQALAQCGKQVDVPEFILRLRQLVLSSRVAASSSYTGSTGSPASASQQFFLQQQQQHQQASPYQQQMSLDLGDMSRYLGGGGASALSFDMWGNLTMENDANNVQQQALPYGGFDFSKLDFTSMDFTG